MSYIPKFNAIILSTLFTLLPILGQAAGGSAGGGGDMSLEMRGIYIANQFKSEFLRYLNVEVSPFLQEGLRLAQISDSELLHAIKKMKTQSPSGKLALVEMAEKTTIHIATEIENHAEAKMVGGGGSPGCHIYINPNKFTSERFAEQLNVIGLHEITHCFGYLSEKAHLISAHIAPPGVLESLNFNSPDSRVFVLPKFDDHLVLSQTYLEIYKKYKTPQAHYGRSSDWESEREVSVERKKIRADFFCLSMGYSRASQFKDLKDVLSAEPNQSEKRSDILNQLFAKMKDDEYFFALYQLSEGSLENSTTDYGQPKANNPGRPEIIQNSPTPLPTEMVNGNTYDIKYDPNPFVLIKCERGAASLGLKRIDSHYDGAPWLALVSDEFDSSFFEDEQTKQQRLNNIARKRADKVCQTKGFGSSGGPLRLRQSSVLPAVYYPRSFNVATIEDGQVHVTYMQEYSTAS